jgi:hypothetical protein
MRCLSAKVEISNWLPRLIRYTKRPTMKKSWMYCPHEHDAKMALEKLYFCINSNWSTTPFIGFNAESLVAHNRKLSIWDVFENCGTFILIHEPMFG